MLAHDPLAPRGSYPYLDGAPYRGPAVGPAAHCDDVCLSRPVCNAASEAHKQWLNSPERGAIETFAASNGFSRVVLVPFGIWLEEDATDTSRKKSEDLIHMRPLLRPHVLQNPRFVTVAGVVQKPSWLSGGEPQPNEEDWAHDAYRNSVAEGFCLRDLAEWDAAGPLLSASFPGLELQPPVGEKLLFVISPFLVGIVGDLESFYHLFGVLDLRCPWCVVSPADMAAKTGASSALRSSTELASDISKHRATLFDPLVSQKAKKAAGTALEALGVKPALVRDVFEQLVLSPTWRLPHTMGASIYDYYSLDSLHVFNQGVVVRAIRILYNAVRAHGDFDSYNRAFILMGVAFADGVRRRISLHGGLKLSLKAQKGDLNYSMLRCMVAALDSVALSDAKLRTKLVQFGEAVLYAHRVCNNASGPQQRQYLAEVVLPWLVGDDCMTLGVFDFEDKTQAPRNLRFPKYHCLQEIPRLFKRWGCHLSFGSMSAFEAAHPVAKAIFRHVSKSPAGRLPQFARLAALRYMFRFVAPMFCRGGRNEAPPPPPADSMVVRRPSSRAALPHSVSVALRSAVGDAGFRIEDAAAVEVESWVRARAGVELHAAPLCVGDFVCLRTANTLIELRAVLEFPGEKRFYAGREWVLERQHGKLHQVRVPAGEWCVGPLAHVLGRAWVYRKTRDAIVYAPALERYEYV